MDKRRDRNIKAQEITNAMIDGIETFRSHVEAGELNRNMPADEALYIKVALAKAGFQITRQKGGK